MVDTECYIIIYGVVEEYCFLVHIAYDAAQRLYGEVAYVGSVDGDAAMLYVVISWYEVDQCRLARARLSHQCDGLTTWYGEVDVGQHLASVAVCKAHIAQFDCLVETADGAGIGALGYVVFGIEYLVYTLHRGHALLYGIACLREVFHGLQRGVENGEVVDECAGVDG